MNGEKLYTYLDISTNYSRWWRVATPHLYVQQRLTDFILTPFSSTHINETVWTKMAAETVPFPICTMNAPRIYYAKKIIYGNASWLSVTLFGHIVNTKTTVHSLCIARAGTRVTWEERKRKRKWRKINENNKKYTPECSPLQVQEHLIHWNWCCGIFWLHKIQHMVLINAHNVCGSDIDVKLYSSCLFSFSLLFNSIEDLW